MANLGTWSNSAVYASLILSSCFLPSLLIRRLGVKWSLVLSVLCYSFYIAAQFYPEFYTLVPTAVVLGMGAAPLWIAKCSYLTQVRAHPSHPLQQETSLFRLHTDLQQLTTWNQSQLLSSFLEYFSSFSNATPSWGTPSTRLVQLPLLPASIHNLTIPVSVYSSSVADNFTVSQETLASCGPQFCPAQLNQAEDNSTAEAGDNFAAASSLASTYKIAGIYLACSLGAALVLAIFVDPLTRFSEDERRGGDHLSGFQLLGATFRQMRRHNQMLIIPLTFWSGIEQGFFSADFTAVRIINHAGIKS